MTQAIIDPLLREQSELIVEETVWVSPALQKQMLTDVANMTDTTRHTILSTMLKMHKELEDECGDLDVSLNTSSEISENTEPWYVILDGNSSKDIRAVRYHYKCNWETSHGVEVIVVNGDSVRFVGHCGYVSSINSLMQGNDEEFSYL